MLVNARLPAPDKGEHLILVSVDAAGDVGLYTRLERVWLNAALEPLRDRVADDRARGLADTPDAEARQHLLNVLRRVAAEH